MPYVLGPRSRSELVGVHPRLVDCVKRAIQITAQDFGVHDGLRTPAEQRKYVASGASQTMNSMHLPQSDGFSHAVDLVPFINGQLRWEWPPTYVIASAMARAAHELKLALTWGGCWDRRFPEDFGNCTPNAMRSMVDGYVERKRADLIKRGRKPRVFIDGPHFELRRR